VVIALANFLNGSNHLAKNVKLCMATFSLPVCLKRKSQFLSDAVDLPPNWNNQ